MQPDAPCVAVEGLVKRFGETLAVDDVTFSIARGESFGYLGPNGAGKTTTIRCLLGLIAPSAGSIRVFGLDLASNRMEILRRVGYIPGELGLWPQATGEECLSYLGRLSGSSARARELCDRFELSRAALGRTVRTYSRGMKQKIGIVQAFQHRPELVVLDEPTEGLDPVMKERFVALVKEHRSAGGTVLLSSHILSEVEETTERVAVLRAGRIVRVGSPVDLTGKRIRHYRLTVRRPSSAEPLASLEGVTNLVASGTTITFDHRGDAAPVIDAVRALDVVDLIVEPESLTESFFEIYGGL